MEKITEIIISELNEASKVLENFISEEKNILLVQEAASLISTSILNGGKVFSCGNGGSACDAMHFAEELTGRFRDDREPIPAICIADFGHITCTANDMGFQHVYSRYLKALGKEGDVLLAISTSGNSQNVIEAAKEARQKQIKVIGLSGNSGGKLAEFCDLIINVPHKGYADRIQEIHIKIIHILILLIEKSLK